MATFYVEVMLALFVIAFFGATAGLAGPRAGDAEELVRNGEFAAEGAGGLPTHWSKWQPLWKAAECRMRRTAEGLLVDAPDRPYAVGGVVQGLKGVRGGQAYGIDVICQARGIPSFAQSVIVRVTWTRKGKLLHPAGMLVRGQVTGGGEAKFHDVLVAPEDADGGKLSLEVKWPQGGSVLWKRASVRAATPPKPRKVRIGTVYLRPRSSTPERNLELWCRKIDEAGKLKLDVVCLCEAILVVGTRASAADVAEAVPGPSTKGLGEAAKKNNIYVVAGLMEREGETLYNTSVLIDRKGKLAGTYRKVHLPREEWKKGVTPGGEYPVFQTDFGTVGMQICYDWFFPEAAAMFALAGAEVLFAPTWGNTLPDKDGCADGETVFRVRARDNGLYMVPSVYDGSSMVIDPMGRILATSKGANEGVYWAEVDLNSREPLWWVGHWRSIGPRHRMPGTYESLTKGP
ncbi:MAG: carbon-nitrogen hydrolase family protein [Phycisphaerae bacterium]